jgi:hypothetical protein
MLCNLTISSFQCDKQSDHISKNNAISLRARGKNFILPSEKRLLSKNMNYVFIFMEITDVLSVYLYESALHDLRLKATTTTKPFSPKQVGVGWRFKAERK